jgi:DNA polymerase III epsilon subunit-like protein
MSVFISFDIETNGETPMLNNMLAIGMVAITLEGEIVWKYETAFDPLEGHESMEKVMNFWLDPSQSNAWAKVQSLPKISALEFYNKVSSDLISLSKKYKDIKFVGKSANFDWMFFKCYYEMGRQKSLGDNYGTSRATGYNIGFEVLDVSELFNAFKIINNLTDKSTISNIEKQLSGMQEKFAHDSLYDATCQGLMYVRLLKMLSSTNPQTSIERQLNNAMSIKMSENLISGGKRKKNKRRYTRKIYKK